ncbi:HEAT repeat domain-containing protein [Paludisphaera sp.]|uniref:HEAT repeat domain-containing protein n=1 Tax=Paludisphaera sp. TaxID=2017432 RepID=UPI00301C73A7
MKPKTAVLAGAALLAASSSAFAQKASQSAGNRRRRGQDELIETLQKPDATRKDRADALRVLAQVGDRECVEAVAPLLRDEEQADMARYAIEPIPHPAVDEALRAVVAEAKGRPLVGAIASLGVRRDAKAVPALVEKLCDSDAQVAIAAAKSLGCIGGAAASQALREALPKSKDFVQAAVVEGLFRAAESLACQKQCQAAADLYDALAKEAPLEAAKKVAAERAGALRKA